MVDPSLAEPAVAEPSKAEPSKAELPVVDPSPAAPAGTGFATATPLSGPAAPLAPATDTPTTTPGRGRWAQLSLQTQLLAILLLLMLAALSVSGFFVQRSLEQTMYNQVQTDLVNAANPPTISAMVLNNTSNSGVAGSGVDPDRDGDHHTLTDYVVAIQIDGQSRAALIPSAPGPTGKPNLTVTDIPSMTSAQASQRHGAYVIRAESGARYLAVSLPVSVGRGTSAQPAAATVLRDLTPTSHTLNQVRLMSLAIGLLVLAGSALLGRYAIRRAFTPLRQVEATAEKIAEGDLSQRIPPYPPTTEVGRLTTSLNGMLAQIESAFRDREASQARTKRFAADASHELRTPLASIRGYAELYRQGAVPPQEVPRALRRIEDEAKRMGGLVEDLLLLARLDEQRPGRSDPVDLLVIAGDAVHDAKALDPERTVRLVGLGSTGPAPAPVIGDDDRLRQVVANLIGNAVRHTPAGTPIEVAVGREREHSVLAVRDHGPGLDPEQSARVFERFYRADASRQRGKGGGSGLGLSIVAAVVAAHRGSVVVDQTPGGGATFVISLPAVAADQS